MRGIRLFTMGIALAGIIALAARPAIIVPTAAAQARDPLAGAWEQTSAKNLSTGQPQEMQKPPLHVLYVDGQYVQFTAAADRQKPDVGRGTLADLTKDQLVDRLRLQGQYGTYRVTGQKLTRHVASAAEPNNVGRDIESDFQIKGDELIVTGTNGQGQKTESHYRRLR